LSRIRDSGLADQSRGFSRIIVEKPLGRDLESARRLNEQIASAFPEEQIYRIDHYLGKETVQNIMLLRFGNEIYEPVWNNRYVDHVQITMAETIGVESRGRYYESAGALRDMMQNHVLQLLCLVAMEPPVDQHPDSVRDEKLKVLKSLKPIRGERVERETVRAQYGRGIVEGAQVPAYREEEGVDPASGVETYAALRVFLDSWRWAGVPFYLRTGKRLSRRTTEISIHFKKPPLALFGDRDAPPAPPNVLAFRIQPHEGITTSFNAKVPGYATEMRAVNMDFSYGSTFGEELPEAYERLLLDAMVGDSTLFMRKDEVDAAWAFITDILDGWRERAGPELVTYRAGTSGPEVAARLLGTAGRRWRRL
jgi:glucose-6-phosphate 1-dehydrogenase